METCLILREEKKPVKLWKQGIIWDKISEHKAKLEKRWESAFISLSVTGNDNTVLETCPRESVELILKGCYSSTPKQVFLCFFFLSSAVASVVIKKLHG